MEILVSNDNEYDVEVVIPARRKSSVGRRKTDYRKVTIPVTLKTIPENEWQEYLRSVPDDDDSHDERLEKEEKQKELLQQILVSVDTDIQTEKQGDETGLLPAKSESVREWALNHPWVSRAITAEYLSVLEQNIFRSKSSKIR